MATATVRGARLRTPLTDLLGLEVPIVQSGMGLVAGPELAAAVSEAGGLGILPGLMSGADELRGQIRRVRELTGRPFGVNLWLHPDVESPPDPRAIPEDVLDRAFQDEPAGFPRRTHEHEQHHQHASGESQTESQCRQRPC